MTSSTRILGSNLASCSIRIWKTCFPTTRTIGCNVGSLEVEFGDLRLAENFLNQARGLSSRDLFIENEWAYLLFKKALAGPRSELAKAYVEEATAIAASIIQDKPASEHPFHVVGSQGLAWSRAGLSGVDEKAIFE